MIKYTEYKYHAAALFTVAVWGATFVSTKVLIAHSLTPAEIFLLRFALAYVCIWPLSKGRLRADGWRDEALLAAAGVTGGSLYFLTENMALEYAPASNVSLIVCTAPVWTALLLSLVYRGERMTRRQIGGSALAFAGMVLVVLNGRFVLHLSPKGDLLALSAALLWMVYSLAVKRIGGRYPAVFITRKVFFYGVLTILPYYLIIPGWPAWDVFMKPQVVGNLLFLGCLASMICFLTWNWCISKLGAVKATNWVYFNPITTMIFASLVLDEKITPYFLAGACCILAGMYIADRMTKSE